LIFGHFSEIFGQLSKKNGQKSKRGGILRLATAVPPQRKEGVPLFGLT